MRKKKDLPLVILKSLERFVNLKGDKFDVVDPKENLLKVIDKELDSGFHFTIKKYQKANNGNFQVLVSRIPRNINDNGVVESWVEISSLANHFEAWIKLLDEYESVASFFDDPITKSFKEEFDAEFEIIDEKAQTNPFDTKRVLLLDSYLEDVENKLDNFKTERNALYIEEIKTEINVLRDNLTSKSKKWVIDKLTRIWAKIAKQGTKLIKEFLSESKKELIKQGVKGLIEYAKEGGTNLLN